jgi:hypothetical protein
MILLFIYSFTFNGHIPVSPLIPYSIQFVQCRFTECITCDEHIPQVGRGFTVRAVLESSLFEVEITIEELKMYKMPDIDYIPTELIKCKMCSGVCELANSIWNMEELPQQWKESYKFSYF